MHIAYAYDRPLPNTGADSEQLLHTIAALARRGIRVELIVPQREGVSISADDLRAYYGVDGPFELRTCAARWDRPRAVAKPAHAWTIIRDPQVARSDFVYTRNLPTVALALRAGLRVVYEHFRPWGDQYPPLQVMLRRWFRHPRFLGAILHSKHARASFERIGIPADRLAVVHNGWDPQRMQPRLARDEARRRFELPIEGPLAVYVGRLSSNKGLDTMLAMARRLPNVGFLLVGSEGQGPIERAAKDIPNVTIAPWQPFDRTAAWLYAADVLVIPPSAAPLQRNTVLPLKLFSYLAAGRPILAPNTPDNAELLHDGVNATLVPPGDVEVAVRALRSVLDQPQHAATLAAGAVATAANLTWDARASRIEAALQQWLHRSTESVTVGSDPWTTRDWLAESLRWGLYRLRGLGRPD